MHDSMMIADDDRAATTERIHDSSPGVNSTACVVDQNSEPNGSHPRDSRAEFGQCLSATCARYRSPLRDETTCYNTPAPRAHLYFAPNTATGISVVYGYAGMPCWNRCSAASSTCTSPASDATIGFTMPCAFISSTTSTTRFAKTIGGVMIVCQ